MARTRKTTDITPVKNIKLVPGQKYMKPVAKVVDELFIPHSKTDVAMYMFPYGKAAKAGLKGIKVGVKGAKIAAKAINKSKKAKNAIKVGAAVSVAKTAKKTSKPTNKLKKKIKP
jgi:hypothetical protein